MDDSQILMGEIVEAEENRDNEALTLVDNIITNTMQMSTVIKTIFRFLDLQEIKKCRFVCQNWNSIAEPLLRKRSKIVFDYQSGRTHTEFAEIFSLSQSMIKFTSFLFNEGDWPVSEIKDFFQKQKRNVQELEFSDVLLKKDDIAVLKPCINDWIADLAITKLKISCVKNWNIEKNLIVSLDVLNFAEEIVLDKCNVLVRQGKKIAPKKLKLSDVVFNVGENAEEFNTHEAMRDIPIKNVIDFKKATHVDIKCPDNNRSSHASQIILNLDQCKNLSLLKLDGVNVLNWGSLHVKHLYLENVPFSNQSRMNIDTLIFAQSLIDLSAISTGVKNISFGHWKRPTTEIQCSQPINFPDLKCVSFHAAPVYSLIHLKNCSNFVNLSVGGQCKELDLDWIPKSVKCLQIGTPTKVIGNEIDVEWLVMESVSLDEADVVLEKIKTENLVVKWRIDADNNSRDRIVIFLEKFREVQKIYIGPFYLFGQTKERESRVFEFAEEMANFYVFEKQMGRPISLDEWSTLNVT